MAACPSSLAVPTLAQPWRLSRQTSLWLHALILLTFMAASSAPTPLYSLYRESWEFSAATLTVVFGVYAISLLLALLVLGSMSDYIGRRPVIVGALVLNIMAMVLFLMADTVSMLIAARLLQGVATGMATSALAAGLMDSDRLRSPLINSVAPMVGLALGALGTSILVQFAPAPMRLVFILLIVAMSGLAIAALLLPELSSRRNGIWQALRPTVSVPRDAWRVLLLIAPLDVAAWALGGFYFSLGPTLAAHVTGQHAPVVGGLLVFTLTITAAVSVTLLRTWAPERMLVFGALSLMSGVAITLGGVQAGSVLLFFLGTSIAGIGFGLGFLGALRTLLPVAQPHERAGLMAAFYIMSYLAFCVPAILAGIATGFMGLEPVAIYYGAALIALASIALIGMGFRSHRRTQA
ncbi:MFS transporter [Allopusillimonas ginsengisoli]|uniref:MFS transporter n=1 Tax=Allopusillimonas ginsengisoli TaxID=453575 RepID=UPI0010C24569|nr:MFS transporter [Allopusillimonas ginsengisoli]